MLPLPAPCSQTPVCVCQSVGVGASTVASPLAPFPKNVFLISSTAVCCLTKPAINPDSPGLAFSKTPLQIGQIRSSSTSPGTGYIIPHVLSLKNPGPRRNRWKRPSSRIQICANFISLPQPIHLSKIYLLRAYYMPAICGAVQGKLNLKFDSNGIKEFYINIHLNYEMINALQATQAL